MSSSNRKKKNKRDAIAIRLARSRRTDPLASIDSNSPDWFNENQAAMERELGLDPIDQDEQFVESERQKKNEKDRIEGEAIAAEIEAFDNKRTLPPQQLLDASRKHIEYLSRALSLARQANTSKLQYGGRFTKGDIFHLRIPPKFLKNVNYQPLVEPFFPCCLFNDPGHLFHKPEFGQLVQYVEYCFSVFSLSYPRRKAEGRFCYGCAFNIRRLVTWLQDGVPINRSWYKKLPDDAALADASFRFVSHMDVPLVVPEFPFCLPSAMYVSMGDQFWWKAQTKMVVQIRSRSMHGWWDQPLLPRKNFSFFSEVEMNDWGDREYQLMQQRTIDETVVSYIGSSLSPYTQSQEIEALKRLTTGKESSWFHAHILDKLLHPEQHAQTSTENTSQSQEQHDAQKIAAPKESRKERRKAFKKKQKA